MSAASRPPVGPALEAVGKGRGSLLKTIYVLRPLVARDGRAVTREEGRNR